MIQRDEKELISEVHETNSKLYCTDFNFTTLTFAILKVLELRDEGLRSNMLIGEGKP